MAQLEGIRVVDLSTFIAGPSCGRILANYGAEVIKVEAPKGDDFRVIARSYKYPAPGEDGHDYGLDGLNANKRDLCINLKDPKGQEAFGKLLASANVFLTNNRVQALKKLGLDYETLHEKYPHLIHASILGYGEVGPLKDKPGFDYTAYFSRGGVALSIMEKDTAPGVPISG
ncbi:CoA transferase, partial [Frisingicoccus sp.]